MAVITLSEIHKAFGSKVIFDGLSAELQTHEKTALIGPNGAGKTTLFRLITGAVSPDLGRCEKPRDLRIGYLPQEPQLDSTRTVQQEADQVFEPLRRMQQRIDRLAEEMAAHHESTRLANLMREYDRLTDELKLRGGYTCNIRIDQVLTGVGFDEFDRCQPVANLSGGQKCRLALAKLLLEQHDYLLLDEPTNHLDIDATQWLEKYLGEYPGGMLVISHDRYLLDHLVEKVAELSRGRVQVFPGNYSNYVETKHLRDLTARRDFQKHQDFIRKERDFIARHLAGQRTKEAQGRRTRLERQIERGELVTESPTHQRAVSLRVRAEGRTGYLVLSCRDLRKAYGEVVLLDGFNLEVYQGERLAITGPNGSGKSTLLEIAIGHIPADGGEMRLSAGGAVGYFDQEHQDLNPDHTVLEELAPHQPDLSVEQLRSWLGAFLFTGDDVFKKIGVLSGGEQSRVSLAKLIAKSPPVLILDEPTNHLDIRSREVLEEALIGYEGTIIFVSHDRYFIDRVATRLLVLRRREYETYLGNYSFYRQQLAGKQEAAEKARVAAAERSSGVAGKSKSKRPADNQAPAQRKRPNPWDALPIETIEEMIIAKEEELASAMAEFGSGEAFKNPDTARLLHERHDRIQAELDELNAYWESRG